jgi:hypothetical protein
MTRGIQEFDENTGAAYVSKCLVSLQGKHLRSGSSQINGLLCIRWVAFRVPAGRDNDWTSESQQKNLRSIHPEVERCSERLIKMPSANVRHTLNAVGSDGLD